VEFYEVLRVSTGYYVRKVLIYLSVYGLIWPLYFYMVCAQLRCINTLMLRCSIVGFYPPVLSSVVINKLSNHLRLLLQVRTVYPSELKTSYHLCRACCVVSTLSCCGHCLPLHCGCHRFSVSPALWHLVKQGISRRQSAVPEWPSCLKRTVDHVTLTRCKRPS